MVKDWFKEIADFFQWTEGRKKLADISSYLLGEDSGFGLCTAEGDKNMSRLYKMNP